MPFLIFGLGSFAVQYGNHFRSGIICGPIWGAFAVREICGPGFICGPGTILNAGLVFAVPVPWASARALVGTGNLGTRIMTTPSTTLVSRISFALGCKLA